MKCEFRNELGHPIIGSVMKKSKDVSLLERLEIEILLGKRYSQRSIASVLNRSPNTISYEVKENSVHGAYDALRAHRKARLRKRMRRLQFAKIEESPPLKVFVIKKLKLHWNPDEISGYMKREKYAHYVSKTAIYDWLRTARGEPYCKCLYSKRRYVKRRKKKTKKILIPNRIGIQERFLGADNRTRFGHWEADTVVGGTCMKGGMKTALERKSRLLVAHRVESMRPYEHAEVLKKIFSLYRVKSATFDNGIENRDHQKLNLPTFFCDPYSSYQKGANENGNKMLRRYFPKGTNFSKVSQEKIDRAVNLINEKPRRILGYRSALDVARGAGIIKSLEVRVS